MTIRILTTTIASVVLLLTAGCATVPDDTAVVAVDPTVGAGATGVPEDDAPGGDERPRAAFERREPPAGAASEGTPGRSSGTPRLAEPDFYLDDAIARRDPGSAVEPPLRSAAGSDAEQVAASWIAPLPVAPQPAAAQPAGPQTAVPQSPAPRAASEGQSAVRVAPEPEAAAPEPEAAGPEPEAAERVVRVPAEPAVPARPEPVRARPEPVRAERSASFEAGPAAAPASRTPPSVSADPAAAAASADPGAPSAPSSPAAAAASGAGERRTEDAPAGEAVERRSTGREPSGPTWNARTARVDADDEIEVVLPGRGWLYVGREYGDGEVTLLGKATVGRDEAFRFRVAGPGSYGLWFQQQDSQTGDLVNERLGLDAVAAAGESAVRVASLPVDGRSVANGRRADAGPSGEEAPSGAEEGHLTQTSRPVSGQTAPGLGSEDGGQRSGGSETGEPADAPAADAPTGGEPTGGERIASLLASDEPNAAFDAFARADADRTGLLDGLDDEALLALASQVSPATPLPVVRAFWRDVASSGSQLAPRARRELYELALAGEAPGDALRAVERLDRAGEATTADLLSTAVLLESASEGSDALGIYARVLTRADDGSAGERAVLTLGDDRLFDLARFFERVGPDRDLRAAARVYRVIVDERPLSTHWEASRSRLEHLRRHYFEVR